MCIIGKEEEKDFPILSLVTTLTLNELNLTLNLSLNPNLNPN